MEEADSSRQCGVGIRGVAMTIDSFVWVGLFFLAGIAVASLTGQLVTSPSGAETDLEGGPALLSLGLWLGLAIGYHTLFEWQFGQTIGKYLVGIQVTDVDGSPLSLSSSLLRNSARLIDWLPLFYVAGIAMLVLSDRNQRLGDRLGGSIVVRT